MQFVNQPTQNFPVQQNLKFQLYEEPALKPPCKTSKENRIINWRMYAKQSKLHRIIN